MRLFHQTLFLKSERDLRFLKCGGKRMEEINLVRILQKQLGKPAIFQLFNNESLDNIAGKMETLTGREEIMKVGFHSSNQ